MTPASAQTLRYANQGELKSLDPYTLKETTTIAHHAHVYEGLVTRDKDLKIVPALAESWETPEPTRWRFHLRKNVKFHNGDPFTADDVIFSADRVRAKGSNFLTNVPADAKFVKVDDYTVDVMLDSPNPILISQWDGWFIMDKKWCEENNAVAPTPASATTPSYASLHENGTGPFTIESHQPGVKTVFKAYPDWWRKPEHNLKEIIFTPIGSAATRVAALLSGEVDVIEPVPTQDIERVNASGNATVLTGPEMRTIFLGMDQTRDELLYSNVKGKNPFKDIRVREAFYKAIDVDLIKNRVMRGLSTPSALMVAPQLFALSKDFTRPKADPDGAKKLMAEAGYPDGFEVTMDCPNDRYVNDAAICQAVVGDAGADRREDQSAGATQGAIFRQGAEARRLPDLVLPVGLDAGLHGFPERAVRHHGLPRRPQGPDPRRSQSRRLLQQGHGCARRQGSGRDRHGQARPTDQAGLRDRDQGLRLYPAAPAGAGLGRFEKSEIDPARRQPGPVLLGDETGIRVSSA